jgi:hypothetical protein
MMPTFLTILSHGMDPWMWEWGFSLGWLFLVIKAAFQR